jgi:hypothetical protein
MPVQQAINHNTKVSYKLLDKPLMIYYSSSPMPNPDVKERGNQVFGAYCNTA